MTNVEFSILLLAMALAAYGCRVAGFLAMRYVTITPRLEAALRATPLSVMAGIVAVAAMRGGPAEWIASVAVLILAKLTGQDVLAALFGVAVIALARWVGL
ncbi:MAG: branched-chain amino acid ABC transporter [Methylobacterium sp.]|nr:MAG: branched-chain amino acid ABC transporter [Methylobacterium sp.]